MALVEVDPDDRVSIGALAALLEAARRVDDPDAFPVTQAGLDREARYGYDLNPPRFFALEPDAGGTPVAVLKVSVPLHDNRHLVYADLTVHPQARGRGHGSALVDALVSLAGSLRRTTLWSHAVADDPGATAFAARHGFAAASADARRQQVLAAVDAAELDRLEAGARDRSAGYELVRLTSPLPDRLLLELVEVTDAINDAPMGELVFEEEVYDLDRLRDAQTARERRGETVCRVVARERATGRIGGHTYLTLHPDHPTYAYQGDTAVARDHRGHRLGLALKIEMMRWLAQAAPRLEVVATHNSVDNRFMIEVNEALGYRLSQTFTMYQRVLG